MKPVVILLFTLFFALEASEGREFTSADGRKVEAEILKVTGSDVILNVRGRHYTLSIAKLSPEDQSYIKEWKKEADENLIPKLAVRVVSASSKRDNSQADGFDDRKGSFEFSLTIENQERDFDLKGAKVLLVAIGEECAVRGSYIVMQRTNFNLNLGWNEETVLRAKKVHYKYDNREPSVWGFQYEGYLLTIKNSKGMTIFSKANPTKFTKNIERATNLKLKDTFDADLEVNGRRSTSYF